MVFLSPPIFMRLRKLYEMGAAYLAIILHKRKITCRGKEFRINIFTQMMKK